MFNTLSPFRPWPTGPLHPATITLEQTEDTVVVTAQLRGIPPSAMEIQVSPTTITLRGQQPLNYGGYALGYREFEQTLGLPSRVRDEQIQRAFRGDRLVITLPKAQPTPWGQNIPWPKTAWGLPLANQARHQGQRLQRSWRQLRQWLGRQLLAAGNQLLGDR